MVSKNYDYLFKLVFIGSAAVGKTSLLLRFSDDIFQTSFLATVGVDFKIRTVEVNNKIAKIQIWDTAGQERFKTISTAYFKGAQGVILTYDITDYQSFKDIEAWLSEIKKYADTDAIKILVGNKSDLVSERQVSFEEGKALADSIGIQFIETSAKDNYNVEKIFLLLTGEIIESLSKNQNNEQRPEE